MLWDSFKGERFAFGATDTYCRRRANFSSLDTIPHVLLAWVLRCIARARPELVGFSPSFR